MFISLRQLSRRKSHVTILNFISIRNISGHCCRKKKIIGVKNVVGSSIFSKKLS